MVKVYIVFGTELADHAMEYDWEFVAKNRKMLGGKLSVREFETEKEAEAYVMGLSDMSGWNDYYVLDDNELKDLSSHIDLSTIKEPNDY